MAYYAYPHFAPRGFATHPHPHPQAHSPFGYAASPSPAFHAHHPRHSHGHGHGLRHPFHPRARPTYADFAIDEPEYQLEYDSAPHAPTRTPTSLDEQERLALAHLHAIQARRAAESAAVQREAAIRAEAQRQREAAIERALEVERQRELAIRRALAQAVEQQQQQEEHRRREIEQARGRSIAHECQREREAARKAYIEQVRARHFLQHQQRVQQQQQQQQQQCARRCARLSAPTTGPATQAPQPAARKQDQDQEDNGLDAMNALFGSLFGINFTRDAAEDKAEVAADKVEPESKTQPEIKKDTPAPTESTKAPGPATATATATKEIPEPTFPEAINDILSQFLGVRVEPATESESASDNSENSSAPGVPEGLNELLAQFGLVFEPETNTTAAPASAATVDAQDPPEAALPALPASAAAPAAATAGPSGSGSRKADATHTNTNKTDETPLTSFLNGRVDLPPFVRDILGNVELAFKEERAKDKEEVKVEGKGKGVAPGEKKVSTPTPAPASAPAPAPTVPDSPTALAQLDSIAHELYLARESFTFPSTLSFATESKSDDALPAPALLFNKTNVAYHAQANKLLQLLLAADGIASGGDRAVRAQRKALVRAVEAEIEALERRRDEVWAGVRRARENGEEGEEVYGHEQDGTRSETTGSASATSSRAASVVDEKEDHTAELEVDEEVVVVEHVEDARFEAEAPAVDGYDVAATPPVASESTDVPATAEQSETEPETETETETKPKSFAEAVKVDSAEAAAPAAPEVKTENDGNKAAEGTKEKDAKEEGYELL